MSWVPTSQSSLQPKPLNAKHPPASQKQATMSTEPTAEQIQQVTSISGLDNATAARYLRVKKNDVNAAINAALDGEDLGKLEAGTTWDESVYQTDRDGNKNLHPLGSSVPNTGRNSPAPSLGVTNPRTKIDEERELQEALAASRGEGDFLPYQQESGRIQQDGSSVQFGPATREQYDANQWAMVPAYSAAQEIVPDLPATERLQNGHEPRMLKHLPDGDYTPNLLTICHAIPRAREAFLMRDHVKSDYGHDSDWWKGQTIPMPRIVHTSDGRAAEPQSDQNDELITEMQRIMAFLDRSDRVYATIGGITSANMIKTNNLQTTNSGSLMELFLQSWVMAATSKIGGDQVVAEQIAGLFTTRVGTNAAQGMVTPELTAIDLSVSNSEGKQSDLFELLDNLLWDTDPNDPEQVDNYIERPADILVMKITNTSSPLGVEVPAVLYIDKYLQQNVAATKSARHQMMQGKKRVHDIERIEKKLKQWQYPNRNAPMEVRKMLDHTLGHYSGKNRKDTDDADKTNSASLASHEPPHYPEVARQLEKVMTSIDQKLSILAEEKEKTLKAVSEMSRADPPGLSTADLKHPYSLRGIATKPNVTYLLQPKSPEDSQYMIPQPDEDTTPEGYQWWRLEYETSGATGKLHRTKVGDYDVIRAAELEHNSALLVYASEDATDSELYSGDDIPDPLQTFIRRDNDDFEYELSQEHPDPPPYADNRINHMDTYPQLSIERRDSLDSTNAVHDRDSPMLDPSQHSAYGLGYGSKLDPDPVEIHLDPPDHDEMDLSGETDDLVRETGEHHAPLHPRPMTNGSVDTVMGGTDSETSDSKHVEDVGRPR